MGELAARYRECESVFMSKDIDKYCSVFLSPNVEMWAPAGPPVVGKEAVTGAFHQMMPTLEVQEVTDLNVVEYGEIGIVTCRTHLKGMNFKNMLVWRKEDGNWVILKDIFISADPPPPGTPGAQ